MICHRRRQAFCAAVASARFMPALAVVSMLMATESGAQDGLSEFSQPRLFSPPPPSHSYGEFQIGFQHISELDLSDNINLLEDEQREGGYRYTGTLEASFIGKIGASDLKGSLGVQFIEQADFDRENDSRTVDGIGNVTVRSAVSSSATNFLTLSAEENEINSSQYVYRTKSSGTIQTDTVSDQLEIHLDEHWQVSALGTLQWESYKLTKQAYNLSRVKREELFERDNTSILFSLSRSGFDAGAVYGLLQLTESTGGSASSEDLDQDSVSVGAGVKKVSGALQYQIELAYGQAKTKSISQGIQEDSKESALFGQVVAQYMPSKTSRIYAGVIRNLSVDLSSSATAALVTSGVIHWQTDISDRWFTGIRFEYPYIEMLGTDYSFSVPVISFRSGYRFSQHFNVEADLNYQRQRANTAAQSAGFTDYEEAELKLTAKWFF